MTAPLQPSRARLHRSIDALPDGALPAAARLLASLGDAARLHGSSASPEADPTARWLLAAEADDQPTTPAEDAGVEAAWQEYLRGVARPWSAARARPPGASAPWLLAITPCAERDLEHLSPGDLRRARAALDGLALERRVEGRELRTLAGEGWRLPTLGLRVRLRADFAARTLVLVGVLPRGRAYRD